MYSNRQLALQVFGQAKDLLIITCPHVNRARPEYLFGNFRVLQNGLHVSFQELGAGLSVFFDLSFRQAGKPELPGQAPDTAHKTLMNTGSEHITAFAASDLRAKHSDDAIRFRGPQRHKDPRISAELPRSERDRA